MTVASKRFVIYLVAMVLSIVGFVQPVQAAMIATDQVHAASAQDVRGQLADALKRPEVLSQLEKMGVSKEDAEARVAALSNEEAEALAAQIDTMPAGADFFAVVGVVVIVLVVTDLVGITDVFPFIRPVR